LEQLREALSAKDKEAVGDRVEELRSWREWLSLETFDYRTALLHIPSFASCR
jgi:hypothetical protein